MRLLALAVPAVTLLLLGCSGEQDPADAGPPKISFTGKLDPALAGTWRTANSDSILTLEKNGALKIESTFNTPKGQQKSSRQGHWLRDSEKLRLQYKENDGKDQTIAYGIKLSGNQMTLSSKVPKRSTVYVRK